nr:putative reverse transcriptase domain-containing protein [Tanacetum cinerariifolium]
EIHYHPGKANVVANALSRKKWMKPRLARAMSMKIHPSIKARIMKAEAKLPRTSILRQKCYNDWISSLKGKKTANCILLNEFSEIHYHPGKANVVANALSMKKWMKPRLARAMSMKIHPSIKARIMEARGKASKDINTPTKMLQGLDKQFKRKEDGELYLVERI